MKTMELFLLLLIIFTTGAIATPPPCHSGDRAALLKIKAAVGNPESLNSQWLPGTDCCNGWTNVVCNNATGRVIEVLILNDNVTGHVSPAIGDLPYLDTLWFAYLDSLSGRIPATITNLKRLTSVRFSYVHLSGPIPTFFSTMNSIQYLDLSFNNFSGHIPATLTTLPNLQTLSLFHNQLTGNIPPFGTHFFKLTYIDFSSNQLTGTIPNSLANLKDLSGLYLNNNKLTGNALFLFDKSIKMERINLSWNRLAIDFSKAEFGRKLSWLVLDHNRIYGKLPEGITEVYLQLFDVSYNRLCGPIPQGKWTDDFYEYAFSNNACLCGNPLTLPCN